MYRQSGSSPRSVDIDTAENETIHDLESLGVRVTRVARTQLNHRRCVTERTIPWPGWKEIEGSDEGKVMTTETREDRTRNDGGVKRHRLQLDFSVEAYERLMRIRRRSEAATNAEVVRNALRLYDWFLEQRHRGASFQVVENGTVKEIEFVF